MSTVYSGLNHALREPLAAEAHSRPSMRLQAPECLTHLAIYAGEDAGASGGNAAAQYALLLSLCAHFGVAGPAANARHFYHDFGHFRLKWECHTEFATYTFAERIDHGSQTAAAFQKMPIAYVPKKWLASLQGKTMVAAHMVLASMASSRDISASEAPDVFEGVLLVGSQVLQCARVWTDFLIQSDGFSRFVVQDFGLREQEAGLLVQRVLEIETYRMMALLGLPHAQRAIPALNAIEGELAQLTAAMVDTDAAIASALACSLSDSTDVEQSLLRQITGLAARVEKLSLDNSYRFSASQAYVRLVHARIEEMREARIDGVPTVAEFMDRRLAPAMNTCASTAQRQEALAARIAHTNDLLRTRVGIVQEQQNRKILQSLNRRAEQQLRLQQAVEGLSVVAITYYLAGLLNYVGKAAKTAGWPISPDLATGILVPAIAAGVWLGLCRMRRKLHGT